MGYHYSQWLHSVWEKQSRAYRLDLHQDLWGNWIVTRTWGSNRRRGYGLSKDTVCADFKTALELFQKQEARRSRRSYRKILLD